MTELEDKLKQVKKDVADTFSKGEVIAQEYMRFVFGLCKKREVFPGVWDDDDIKKTATIALSLEKQLSIRTVYGLGYDYLVMKGAQIRWPAKDDIKNYKLLKQNIKNYLKENLKEPVFEDDLNKTVGKKVLEYTRPDVNMGRRSELIGHFQSIFEREMKPVKKQDYEIENIEKALENI